MLLVLLLYNLAILNITDAVSVPIQRVSPAVVTINGSVAGMGCRAPAGVSAEATTCGARSDGFISYLIDGVSPDIDTSSSNWASQLVTVRRSEGSSAIPIPHVLLTFGFDTPVSVTGIEIDLFNCPDWGIGALSIGVSPQSQYNVIPDFSSSYYYIAADTPLQQSCDSLSTASIMGSQLQTRPYQTFHVVVLFEREPVDWVYVGEVRFLESNRDTIKFQETSVYVIPTKSVIATHYYSKGGRYIEATGHPQSVKQGSAMPNTTIVMQNMKKKYMESRSSLIVGPIAIILLIVILSIVILGLCLLIIRMRRSSNKTKTYTETTNPITDTTTDVPVSHNEAYALTKITNYSETTNTTTCASTDVPVSTNEAYELTKWTRPGEEVTYEIVK